MANLGSENTPIEGESFGLPSGYSFDEENGDLVIRDTDGTVAMRRADGTWELESDLALKENDISGVGAFDSESVNTGDATVENESATISPAEVDLLPQTLDDFESGIGHYDGDTFRFDTTDGIVGNNALVTNDTAGSMGTLEQTIQRPGSYSFLMQVENLETLRLQVHFMTTNGGDPQSGDGYVLEIQGAETDKSIRLARRDDGGFEVLDTLNEVVFEEGRTYKITVDFEPEFIKYEVRDEFGQRRVASVRDDTYNVGGIGYRMSGGDNDDESYIIDYVRRDEYPQINERDFSNLTVEDTTFPGEVSNFIDDGDGSIDQSNGEYLEVSSGPDAGDAHRYLKQTFYLQSNRVRFDRKQIIDMDVNLRNDSTHFARGILEADPVDLTRAHVGFSTEDGKLFGTIASGDSNDNIRDTVELRDLDYGESLSTRIVYDPSTPVVEYWVAESTSYVKLGEITNENAFPLGRVTTARWSAVAEHDGEESVIRLGRLHSKQTGYDV